MKANLRDSLLRRNSILPSVRAREDALENPESPNEAKQRNKFSQFLIDSIEEKHSSNTPMFFLGRHGESVECLALSVDGCFVASGTNNEGSIKIWNLAEKREEFVLLGHLQGVKCLAFTPNGELLFSGSADGTIKAWDMKRKQFSYSIEHHTAAVTSISISPKGTELISGSADTNVRFWSISLRSRLEHEIDRQDSPVISVLYSPDGKKFACSFENRCIQIYDLEQTLLVFSIENDYQTTSLVFTLDSNVLIAGSEQGTISLWEVRTERRQQLIQCHSNRVTSLALTPDGKTLSSSSFEGSIKTFDLLHYSSQSCITSHNGKVNSILYAKDGRHLISGSDDKNIRVFNVKVKNEGKVYVYHSEEVRAVSISPSGKYLASVSSKMSEIDGSRKGLIIVWDLNNNCLFREKVLENPSPTCLAFSNGDDEYIAIESKPKQVYLWEFQEDQYSRVLGWHSLAISAVSFSKTSEFLATGSKDKDLCLWNIYDDQQNFVYCSHRNEVTAVCFCQNTRYLVSGSYDRTVKLWDIIEKQEKFSFEGHMGVVRSVLFSKDGKYILSASGDKTIKCWNIDRKKEEFCMNGHKQAVFSLALSPDGTTLASGSEDNSIKIWNMKEFREEFSLIGHTNTVNSVFFSPNGECLVSSSTDKTIRLWDFREKKPSDLVLAHQFDLLSTENPSLILEDPQDRLEIEILEKSEEKMFRTLAFSSTGKYLAVGDNIGFLQIWDMITNRLHLMIKAHTSEIRSLCFSPDNKLLVSCSVDKRVRLWDVTVGRSVPAQFQHLESVRSVAFSPNSERIASGSTDRTVKLWNVQNLATIREEFTFMGHYATVSCVVFDITGKIIASGSYDFTIKLWCVVKKEELFTLTGHLDCVNSICFSNDGKTLVSGSNDGSIKLWNIKEEREDFSMCTVDSSVNSIVFSSDGNYIAAGCGKGYIKILNVKQRQEEFTLQAHDRLVYCVLYHPDGKSLISSSRDGTVKSWRLKENEKNFLQQQLTNFEKMILSPKLTHAAVIVSEQMTEIWSLEDERRLFSVNDFRNSEKTVVFSDDGRFLALRDQGNRVSLRSFGRDQVNQLFEDNKGEIISLSFSSDSTLLGSCSKDCKIVIWELNNFTCLKTVDLGKNYANCLKFTFRNDFIIYALNDFSIRGERLDSSLEILNLKIEHNEVKLLEVSQDYKYISILSSDNSIKVFEIRSEAKVFSYKIIVSVVLAIRFSNNSRFMACQTLSGFILFDLKHKKRVDSFKIKELETFSLALKIKSSTLDFKFQIPLIINPVLEHIADYQQKHNCEITLNSKIIDTNSIHYSPNYTLDHYYQNYFTFRGTISGLNKNSSSRIFHRHSQILISEFKYTILHFASLKGDQAALKRCLHPDCKVVIRTDVFGKSPLFYSISKRHQKCVQILLNYLIELKTEYKEIMTSSLNATRNDFLLIIQNSSKQLPGYLNKIILDFEVVSIPATKKMPMFQLSECFIPKLQDFGVKTKKTDIPAILKQTAFKIPIQPYSKQNFQMLESILNCYNLKIFENVLVKYIVDYNWQAIYPWAFWYSFVVFLNIIGFVFASYFDRLVFLNFIPFIFTTLLLLGWEIIQMISNGKAYLTHHLNLLDVLSIVFSFYWVLSVQMSFNEYYEEFFLAFLLFFRGLTCFRVIQGMRYYINLVLSSVSSIKYFILIFFYSTFFFAILFHIGAFKDLGLSLLIEKSWRLNFTGEAELTGNDTLLYVSVFLATIVNQILMLNMLISILGDSYDQFMIDKNVIDYKEKIDIVMEVQTVVNCKRVLRNQLKYFHALTSPIEELDINRNDWEGKIVYLEKRQEKRIEELSSRLKKSEERVLKSFHLSEERINQNEIELSNDLKALIAKLDQKLENGHQDSKRLNDRFENIENHLIGINFMNNLPQVTPPEILGIDARLNRVETEIETVKGTLNEILQCLRERREN